MQKINMNLVEFAGAVGVSTATIHRKLGEFAHLRVGKRILFNEESVKDFTEKFTRRPKQSKGAQVIEAR